MWFMIIALVSIATSLVLGRLLAKARVEQTNPFRVGGPSLADRYPPNRNAVTESARRRHMLGAEVHLN